VIGNDPRAIMVAAGARQAPPFNSSMSVQLMGSQVTTKFTPYAPNIWKIFFALPNEGRNLFQMNK
jgi:hypothetical protein